MEINQKRIKYLEEREKLRLLKLGKDFVKEVKRKQEVLEIEDSLQIGLLSTK